MEWLLFKGKHKTLFLKDYQLNIFGFKVFDYIKSCGEKKNQLLSDEFVSFFLPKMKKSHKELQR